ncbi:hypothetical protein [Pseudolysinimonas sp.]|uniref:hypothetical protein n=1 Tax=Pseudolysinimonas sp. TaxID=2680009 RepID=UPI00286A3BA7|nr:hypothetical protein [Pseudolysinimonas sp.]
MSNVLVEVAITDTHSAVAPDSIRGPVPAVTELVVGPRPAFGNPYAIRLSAELVEVMAHWLQRSQWRHGISYSHPAHRRF